MSKNQQIIILVLAVLISIGLIVDAVMNKQARKAGADKTRPPVTAPAALSGPKPQPKDPPPPIDTSRKYVPPAPLKPVAPNKIYRPNPVVARTAAVRTVHGQMRLLSVSITASILRRQMGYEHLELLDFSPAENVEGGSPYAVFNTKGVIRFRGLMNQWLDQETLDEVTTEPGQYVWYSLRRQQTPEAAIDALYAVIPNPGEALCNSSRAVNTEQDLQFANDNGTVVKDKAGALPPETLKIATCVTAGGRKYWFYPLRNRLLRPGAKSWQAVP